MFNIKNITAKEIRHDTTFLTSRKKHAEKAGKSLFDESFFKSDVSVGKYMNEKYIKPEVYEKAFHLLIHYISLPQLWP